jgi:hypothetical protein
VEMLIIVTPTTKKNAENWVDLMLFHDEYPPQDQGNDVQFNYSCSDPPLRK